MTPKMVTAMKKVPASAMAAISKPDARYGPQPIADHLGNAGAGSIPNTRGEARSPKRASSPETIRKNVGGMVALRQLETRFMETRSVDARWQMSAVALVPPRASITSFAVSRSEFMPGV